MLHHFEDLRDESLDDGSVDGLSVQLNARAFNDMHV
jgi:hypothetical protein